MDIYAGHTPAEMVLQSVLQGGLAALQANQSLLERLIQRYQQASRDAIFNYILKNQVAVRLAFAREPWEIPQISILLASETEQRFIGDELAIRDTQFDVTAKTASEITALQEPPFDLSIDTIVDGPLPDACRIKIGNEFLAYNAVIPAVITPPAPAKLHIVTRGIRRTAAAAYPVGSDITAWQIEKEIGVHQLSNYRMDVLHDNADIVIFLQQVVKWILLLNWEVLDDEGFTEMQMSGSDFQPRPQFYPEMLYMRSLTLSTRISEGVPQPMIEALALENYPTLTGVIPTRPVEIP